MAKATWNYSGHEQYERRMKRSWVLLWIAGALALIGAFFFGWSLV